MLGYVYWDYFNNLNFAGKTLEKVCAEFYIAYYTVYLLKLATVDRFPMPIS